ncbi:unnamed protein product, partial [Prorocentrum cordatum]
GYSRVGSALYPPSGARAPPRHTVVGPAWRSRRTTTKRKGDEKHAEQWRAGRDKRELEAVCSFAAASICSCGSLVQRARNMQENGGSWLLKGMKGRMQQSEPDKRRALYSTEQAASTAALPTPSQAWAGTLWASASRGGTSAAQHQGRLRLPVHLPAPPPRRRVIPACARSSETAGCRPRSTGCWPCARATAGG